MAWLEFSHCYCKYDTFSKGSVLINIINLLLYRLTCLPSRPASASLFNVQLIFSWRCVLPQATYHLPWRVVTLTGSFTGAMEHLALFIS